MKPFSEAITERCTVAQLRAAKGIGRAATLQQPVSKGVCNCFFQGRSHRMEVAIRYQSGTPGSLCALSTRLEVLASTGVETKA